MNREILEKEEILLRLNLDETLGGRPKGWEAQRLELWRFGEWGDAADPKAIKLRREVVSGLQQRCEALWR